MVKRSFMTISQFEEKYEVCKNTVQSFLGQNTNTGYYIQRKGSYNLIDENYFLRRKEFKKRIWLENHKDYYILTEKHNQFTLAGVLSDVLGSSKRSWNSWMNDGLFSLSAVDGSIVDTKVSTRHWKFYRFCRALKNITLRVENERNRNVHNRHKLHHSNNHIANDSNMASGKVYERSA